MSARWNRSVPKEPKSSDNRIQIQTSKLFGDILKVRHLYLLTFVYALAIPTACKTTRPVNSDLKHTLGEVSWSEGRWTYLELDQERFIKMNPSNYLPDSHELSLKAKSWIERIHAAVVAKYPEKMSGIPKPQIIVMKKASPDAFAARRRSIAYKLEVAISDNNSDDKLPLSETQPLYFSKPNQLSHNIFPVELSIDVDDAKSYSSWFSSRFAPCTIKRAERGNVKWAYGDDCGRESYFKPNQWSPSFVTQLAPNWVIITSGLFSALPNEESLVAVLAHELAHYYRAHVVNDSKDLYSHCYLLNDPMHKPVEREELKNLCRDLKVRRDSGGVSPEEAATKVGLGVYTYEQEADELALEFLTLLGIEPIRATDAWFALFAIGMGPDSSKREIDQCRTLFKNDWLDASGKPVTIPLGGYEDPHHSWCFRVFNTTREIKAHGYDVPYPVTLDAEGWRRLQALSAAP